MDGRTRSQERKRLVGQVKLTLCCTRTYGLAKGQRVWPGCKTPPPPDASHSLGGITRSYIVGWIFNAGLGQGTGTFGSALNSLTGSYSSGRGGGHNY